MNDLGTVTLETEHLMLRKFKIDNGKKSSDKVEFKFNKENIILNNYDYINDNLLEPWQSILIFIKK